MKLIWKSVSSLCVGGLLLACGDLGQLAPAPAAGIAADADAESAYQAGRRAQLEQRWDAAEAAYRVALRRDARHVGARNALASVFAQRGRLDEAIALWRELTRDVGAVPGSAFLFGNLGYAYLMHGDNALAQATLEKACLLDPLNDRAWQHLGEALARSGQGERAQLMYRQARALQEHDLKADFARVPHTPAVAAVERAVHDPASASQEMPASEPASPTSSRDRPSAQSTASAPSMSAMATTSATSAPQLALAAFEFAPLRLEIRNGNGVTGLARALGRRVSEPGVQVIRVANEKGYAVRRTRIEYPPQLQAAAEHLAVRIGLGKLVAVPVCKSADLRVVIGHDLRRVDDAVNATIASKQVAMKRPPALLPAARAVD